MNRKAQSSVELMTLLAVVMMILGVITLVAQKQYSASQDKLRFEKAGYTADKIVWAANFIRYQGKGAETDVLVATPPAIKDIYVGDISNREPPLSDKNPVNVVRFILHVRGGETDVVRATEGDIFIMGGSVDSSGNEWITLVNAGYTKHEGKKYVKIQIIPPNNNL